MSDGVPNAGQMAGWDGPEGDNWTEHEDFYNNANRAFTPLLMSAAAIAPGDRVLDVGCGCGQTTRLAALAAAPGGEAVGMDLSSQMLARGRERAAEEGIANVRFEQGDAQTYSFPAGAFDAAISRFGVMFFDDPDAAFANIGRALRTGGRLAMLVWRDFERNEWVKTLLEVFAAGRDLPPPPPNAPSPFALADPERTTKIVAAAGFADVSLKEIDAGMWFGRTVDAAYESMMNLSVVRGLLTDVDDAARAAALTQAREELKKRQREDGVWFAASAWLIRATATR
ncbi:MAG TPA: class I SAM-dependent methyltransferase [Actinomycetota bacterium]